MSLRAATQPEPAALWRQPEFLKLWIGQTVSLFGSSITVLALSLTAVLILEATPSQMGILGAAGSAPFLLVGLIVGVWVDRVRRRPILIGADVGRAALLLSIPLAAALGLLRIEQLYAVAFLVGVLTVFFDVAYQSYLPALVGREHLVEANGRLEVSRSVAQIGGPSLAGGLVQLVSAPLAILCDAASFAISAVSLALIRSRELPPTASNGSRSAGREIREGLAAVFGDRSLRAIAGCTGTWNLFSAIAMTVLVLYATRELGVMPGLLGAIMAAGGAGALLGALLAGPSARRFGTGPAIVWAAVLGASSNLLLPLASGPLVVAVPLLMGGLLFGSLAGTAYNVNQVSLRQAITPDHLLGRMNATMRFLVWGTIPLGALLGGALGEQIGLRPTLFVAALGALLGSGWVLCSPLRSLRAPPHELVARS